MSLNNKIKKPTVLSLIFCTALGGCATGDGRAGYVPPEALASPSAKMSEALLAFGGRVQTENLVNYRRAAREDMYRGAIRDFLMGENITAKIFSDAMPDPKDVLCKARYGYLRIATPVELTNAKAKAIQEVLMPPSAEIKELLKATKIKFTIDVTEPTLSPSYDAWLTTQGASCATAVANADPFVTRDYIGREVGAVVALTAFKTLFDTVWGIVKPALIGGLQNAEIERRNRAVRDFFSDEKNTTVLKNDLEHIENFLRLEFELQHKRTAGISVAAQASMTTFTAAHWTSAMGIVAKGGCHKSIRNLATVKTDAAGVACLNNVYAALAAPLNAALDTADVFDASIEKELPKQKLSEQIDTLAALAQGKMSDEERVRATWGVLVRYATLYDTIKETGSEANQKKWDEAVDALKKAIQQ